MKNESPNTPKTQFLAQVGLGPEMTISGRSAPQARNPDFEFEIRNLIFEVELPGHRMSLELNLHHQVLIIFK